MRRTSFSTSVVTADTTAVILVRGELDLATAPQLDAAVASCLDRGYTTVEVDLHDVTFMACAGLNVLLDRRARAAGARLAIIRPSPVVARLLTLAGVSALLGSDGVDDALGAPA